MLPENHENQSIPTPKNDDIIRSIEQFLIDKKSQDRAWKTIRAYEYDLKKFVKFCYAHSSVTNIHQITPTLIQEFYNMLREEGKENGGINHFHRSIRAFLSWYWWFNDIRDATNPITRVKAPKLPNEPLDPVTEEQIHALRATCRKDNFTDSRDDLIFALLAVTGCRASELCSIEINNIGFARNQIYITETKNGKSRTVYFLREEKLLINRFLSNHSKSDKWLFTNQMGEKLVYTAIRQIMRRRCDYAKIDPPVTLHGFRRYFTLKSRNKGMSDLDLSRILVHAHTSLLRVYAKTSSDDLQVAFKRVWEKDR